jgi:hypothetical protein
MKIKGNVIINNLSADQINNKPVNDRNIVSDKGGKKVIINNIVRRLPSDNYSQGAPKFHMWTSVQERNL